MTKSKILELVGVCVFSFGLTFGVLAVGMFLTDWIADLVERAIRARKAKAAKKDLEKDSK